MRTLGWPSLLLLLVMSSSVVAELPAKPAAKTPSNGAIEITLDAAKTGPAINPFIYGQFIEPLGRCVYGGIWAEMLEDRKFFFPVSDEYKPYRDLKGTKFPVVGASPWEVIGPAGSVT